MNSRTKARPVLPENHTPAFAATLAVSLLRSQSPRAAAALSSPSWDSVDSGRVTARMSFTPGARSSGAHAASTNASLSPSASLQPSSQAMHQSELSSSRQQWSVNGKTTNTTESHGTSMTSSPPGAKQQGSGVPPIQRGTSFVGQYVRGLGRPGATGSGDLATEPGRISEHQLKGMRGTPTIPAYASDIVACAEVIPRPGRDFYGIPNPPEGSKLLLRDLRERLIRQEETIIFALIERAQFRLNPVIYKPRAFPIPDFEGTFSQYVLYELEKVNAKVRRYTSPDEHPFAAEGTLPPPLLEPLDYPPTLMPNNINYNNQVESMYLSSILPVVCEDGDDQNYGSSATCDVACLQALSKRIHYGKFIAESKFQEDPEQYSELARNGDSDAIWALLSDLAVEEKLLARVENKARNYGVDVTPSGTRPVYKVEPKAIADIYRDYIIPLTKVVEVDYLLQRHLHHKQ